MIKKNVLLMECIKKLICVLKRYKLGVNKITSVFYKSALGIHRWFMMKRHTEFLVKANFQY